MSKKKKFFDLIYDNNKDLLKWARKDMIEGKAQRIIQAHYHKICDEMQKEVDSQAEIYKGLKDWDWAKYWNLVNSIRKFNKLEEEKNSVQEHYKFMFWEDLPRIYEISMEDIAKQAPNPKS